MTVTSGFASFGSTPLALLSEVAPESANQLFFHTSNLLFLFWYESDGTFAYIRHASGTRHYHLHHLYTMAHFCFPIRLTFSRYLLVDGQVEFGRNAASVRTAANGVK